MRDRALMVRIQHRDEAAYEELKGHYYKRLLSHARKRLCAGEFNRREARVDAERFVVETLKIVWYKASQYKSDRAAPSRWIYTILNNKINKEFGRRRKRRPETGLPNLRGRNVPGGLTTPAIPLEHTIAVRAASKHSKEWGRCEEFYLKHEKKDAIEEMARAHGISVSAMRSQLQRDKRVLRKAIDATGYDHGRDKSGTSRKAGMRHFSWDGDENDGGGPGHINPRPKIVKAHPWMGLSRKWHYAAPGEKTRRCKCHVKNKR